LQNPNVLNAVAGNYTVTVNVAGCTSTATTTVVLNALPAAFTPTTPVTYCIGGTLSLTGNPSSAGTYAWSGPNGF
ncbi:MAG TPA: hypothetical protein DCQ31_14650, partial [Bacteroidales bacterium]|nr:hypothetical protein [Bacteroidales bacterium]